ncbi:hypothetical protein ACHAXN_010664 [Cyclotella atomus]
MPSSRHRRCCPYRHRPRIGIGMHRSIAIIAVQQCCILMVLLAMKRGNALLMPGQICRQINAKSCHRRQIELLSQPVDEIQQNYHLSSAIPYNKDIARTLFPRFFFSLDQHKSTSNEQHQKNVRRYPARPCSFQYPNSAQTSERMLRRMMENRYQSDGRTVCPDATTFNLVAGAFGRLRFRTQGESNGKFSSQVTWEEEPKVNPAFRTNLDCKYNQIVAYNETNELPGLIVMTPAMKLQELLQLQLQLCHYENWTETLCPSVETYNRILKRIVGTAGGAEVAWKMYHFMKSPLPMSDSIGTVVCEPNAKTCLHVIRALTVHKPAAAPSMHMLKRRGEAPNAKIQPIEELSNELGIELSLTTMPIDSSMDWFLSEAEKVLKTLIESHCQMPECKERDEVTIILAECISTLLEGWGKYAVLSSSSESKEKAIIRANELLCMLEQLVGADGKGNVDIPSSSYASVILGLSVSNERNSASLAKAILDKMMLQFEGSTYFDVEDIVTAYSACIASYAKKNDARGAESVLYDMLDLYDSKVLGDQFVPDSRTFITVLSLYVGPNGYSTSPDQSRGHQRLRNADNAENILAELERVMENERAKGNEFKVDATPYNYAIQARVQVSLGLVYAT